LKRDGGADRARLTVLEVCWSSNTSDLRLREIEDDVDVVEDFFFFFLSAVDVFFFEEAESNSDSVSSPCKAEYPTHPRLKAATVTDTALTARPRRRFQNILLW
jgi:hypothetical protein